MISFEAYADETVKIAGSRVGHAAAGVALSPAAVALIGGVIGAAAAPKGQRTRQGLGTAAGASLGMLGSAPLALGAGLSTRSALPMYGILAGSAVLGGALGRSMSRKGAWSKGTEKVAFGGQALDRVLVLSKQKQLAAAIKRRAANDPTFARLATRKFRLAKAKKP